VPDLRDIRLAVCDLLPKFQEFLLQPEIGFLHLRIHLFNNIYKASAHFGWEQNQYSPTILRLFPFAFEGSDGFAVSAGFFAAFPTSCSACWATCWARAAAFSALSSA
jgi:hypothetical protein